MSAATPVAERFTSLAALKAAHSALLQARRAGGMRAELLDAIALFVAQGQATGVLLDDVDVRASAQSVLTYWANTLYRAGREPPDSTLADFDPQLAPELPDALCPYLGLDAFHEQDTDKFFGRRELMSRLVERLVEHRLLAVVGPSGSGKSSLVRAGLIPALKHGALPGSQEWNYLPPIVPGSEPLVNLERCLAATGQHNAQPLVLIVDQFEELWTLCEDEDTRLAFIDRLIQLLTPLKPPHRVIVTMRSDFETFVARAPALQALFDRGRMQVTPLSASELREAIERPAASIGLRFEAGVVDLLLQDILGEPAGLPLLQFTLLKLWERRERNCVTRAAYERAGGGRRALARSADALYSGLIPEEQITARRVLLRMVRPGEGLEITSGRVRRDDLYRSGEDPGRIERVLTKLLAARLVRLTPGKTSSDDQIEVAHEALVRNWPTLVEWLEEERATLMVRRRLENRAAEWLRLGQGMGGLLDDVELRETERWLGSSAAADLGYDPTLLALVATSRRAIQQIEAEKEAARMRELDQARQLAQSQTRAKRMLRVLIVLMAIVSLWIIYQQRQLLAQADALLVRAVEVSKQAQQDSYTLATAEVQARAEREVAITAQADSEQLRRAAAAQTLAGQVGIAAERDPELGLLIAIDAAHQVQNGQITDVNGQIAAALRQALRTSFVRIRMSGHTGSVSSAVWSSDGQRVLTTSDDRTARVWDANTGQPLLTLIGHTDTVLSAAWSPDGQRILTTSTDRTARIWDAATGNLLHVIEHKDIVRSAAWSPNGQLILTASNDRAARIWDAGTYTLLAELPHNSYVSGAFWSPSGERVLTTSDDQTAGIWETASGQLLHTLTSPVGIMTTAAWSPNGHRVMTASFHWVVIWDAESGQPLQRLDKHTSNVDHVAWSLDNQFVATAAGNPASAMTPDTTVRIWEAATGRQLLVLNGHTNSITDMAWSNDGKRLLTASGDGTARIWNTSDGTQLVVLRGHGAILRAASWSPDQQRILTAGNDAIARIWDSAEGTLPDTLTELLALAGHRVTRALTPAERVQYGLAPEVPSPRPTPTP